MSSAPEAFGASLSRHALRFQKSGLRDWIAWAPHRRGAYLITERPDGTWIASYTPQLSAKHPKPVFGKIGEPVPGWRDALAVAQSHYDALRTSK